jgi:hypothetical protein
MGKDMLIADVPYMSKYTKDALKEKSIRQLSDLSVHSVVEAWTWICRFGCDKDFKGLLHAMKAQRVAFCDVDPNEVDLLADDISSLELSPRADNALKKHELLSFAMLERLKSRELLKEVRNLGPQSLAELQTALATAGVSLADD